MESRQRRLKIAMVSDTVNGAAGAGGAVSGQILVNRLRKNHDVRVVSADSTSDIRMRGIRPTISAAVKHQNFVFAIPDRRALREAFADVDIVHLYLPFWLCFAAMDEARKLKKPVVTSFHVQPENILLNLHIRWPWLCRKIYKFWINRLWNRSDLMLCPSTFAVQKLQSHGLQTPAMAVSNGIAFDISPNTYEREESHKGYFLIVMIGRLAPEKQQKMLIEAVRLSPHREKIKLVIAGKGQDQQKLQRLAKALPNGAEICFVSEERKQRLLATADLFVHCSAVELEGMAVLEAMGAGLPVLVAEGPETAASSFALSSLRFPATDANALSKKINWLIENPDELANARKYSCEASRRFNVVDCINSIEDKYWELCK